MERRKILILGAGSFEIDVIKYAKLMNYYTVVTDSNTDWSKSPAKEFADEAWNISWSDIDALVNACRDRRIDGVFAGFSEKRIQNAAELCDKLGYPFYTDGSNLDLLLNKPSFMKLCEKVGFTIPTRYSMHEQVVYPVIVKPNGTASSLGISVCHNDDEYRTAITEGLAVSADGTLEIESYIQNADEIIAWYIVRNGEISLAETCDMYMKVLDPRKPQIPLGFRFPSKYEGLLLKEYNSKFEHLLNECCVQNGLVGFQCLVKGNDIIPYDPTYRVDSTMVHHITEWLNGSNSLKMLINYSMCAKMNDEPQFEVDLENRSKKIIYLLPIFVKDGTITKIVGLDQLAQSENIISLFENYKPGDTISKTSVTSSLYGTITFAVKSEDDLEKTLSQIFDYLKVINTEGENLILQVDYKAIAMNNY